MEVLREEPLPGVKVIDTFYHKDSRGSFCKTYNQEALGFSFDLQEEFYSVSKKGVLRGMHFQVPPHAHQKLVTCSSGSILDVLLDLRKDSESFGKSVGIELTAENHKVILIPVGIAHGFYTLEDDSCVIYKTDHCYRPESDRGIRWDSFGFDWPDVTGSRELSDRDRSHPTFRDFNSPFDRSIA